jgi:RHS repeat-associated protein
LTDAVGSIAVVGGVSQFFAFDAYGEAKGFTESAAATTLLYSGEWFQMEIEQQYLRARFYNQKSGRFDRSDPFFGNLRDPQSLHKYAYVHNDPISGIDPTGKFFSIAGIFSAMSIQTSLRAVHNEVVMSALSASRAGLTARPGENPYLKIIEAFGNELQEAGRDTLIGLIPVVGGLYNAYQVGLTVYAISLGLLEEWNASTSTAPSTNFPVAAMSDWRPRGTRMARLGFFVRTSLEYLNGNVEGLLRVFFRQQLWSGSITSKLSRGESKAYRSEATDIWRDLIGFPPGGMGLQIHHRIPLEWSHLLPNAHPNRLSNLVGIRAARHEEVNESWRQWKSSFGDREPTPLEVMKKALEVDEQFMG